MKIFFYRLWICLVICGIGVSCLLYKVTQPQPSSENPTQRIFHEPILSLVFHPSVSGYSSLYIGTKTGLYFSKDEGRSWNRLFHNAHEGGVQAIAQPLVNLSSVYAASDTFLFSSSNGGQTWRQLVQTETRITCIAICPQQPHQILVGTEQGLYESQDNGLLWSKPFEMNQEIIRALLYPDPGTAEVYALTDSTLFHREESGIHWKKIGFSINAGNENLMEELGSEETEKPLPLPHGLAFQKQTQTFYLGTTRGILTSSDGGQSWAPLPTLGLGTPEIIQILIPEGLENDLYAFTKSDLFFYRADQKRWEKIKEFFSGASIRAAAMNPDGTKLFLGTKNGLLKISLPPIFPLSRFSLISPKISKKPSIQEIQQVAIQYAEVMPEKIKQWRRGAVLRTWFPKLTLSASRDQNRTVVSATSSGKTSFSIGPDDQSLNIGIGLTWDLANLIWNPDQISIDVRSRLMVQLRQDILEEVTRLYFERKRLLTEFRGNPTEDPILQAERTLRTEELTAQLDALTGGEFSQKTMECPP